VASPALRRAAAVQALSNAAVGSTSLFVALLAVHLGADALQIGLIGACYGGAYFVSSWVFGTLADAGRRRYIIRLGAWAAALAAPLHVLATDPWTLALARGAFGFAAGIAPAALIAYAYDAERRPGRFGAWGALGWGTGTLAAGFLTGFREVFALASLAMLAAFLVALRLEPRPEARVKVRVAWVPRSVLRNNFPAYLAMLLRHTGAAAVWVIFPLYLVQLGASPLWLGVLYFLNTGTQFLFMSVMDRYPAGKLVLGGLAASAATFVLFALAPVFWFILPVQLLVAASWAMLYVGALAWGMERNEERATSTGLLQSVMSFSNMVGPLLGGVVAAAGGYTATLAFAAALSFLAMPVFHLTARRADRGRERPAREVVLGTPEPAAEPSRPGLEETLPGDGSLQVSGGS